MSIIKNNYRHYENPLLSKNKKKHLEAVYKTAPAEKVVRKNVIPS